MLSGTRLEGAPPGATNRLYKNNRDGTFTDVTDEGRADARPAGPRRVTVGDYNNDGFDDLFITYYGQNVLYHNNGDGTFTDVTEKAGLRQDGVRYGSGLHVGRLRPRRPPRSVRRQLPELRRSSKLPKPGENADCNWKGVPVNCGPRGLPPGTRPAVITTTATARSPTSAGSPASPRRRGAIR